MGNKAITQPTYQATSIPPNNIVHETKISTKPYQLTLCNINIPFEIFIQIFSYIPPESLLTARRICHAFYDSIKDEFWKNLFLSSNLIVHRIKELNFTNLNWMQIYFTFRKKGYTLQQLEKEGMVLKSVHTTSNREIKIALLGDSGVGKSTYLYAFSYNQFPTTGLRSTTGVEFKMLYYEMKSTNYKLSVWDCGGGNRYKSIMAPLISRCRVVFLFYDTSNKVSFQHLDEWYNELKLARFKNLCVIIVGIVMKNTKRTVSIETAKMFALSKKLNYLEIDFNDTKLGNIFAAIDYEQIADNIPLLHATR